MTAPRKKPKPPRARPERVRALVDSARRMERGAALIQLSRASVGGNEEDTTAAGDLVADVLHVLGAADGRKALRRGLSHFLEETDGYGPGDDVAALTDARDAL